MASRFSTLNIGASGIEFAEYECGPGKALTLVNYGCATLPAPLDGGNAETILAPAILELVREKGFKTGKVAISVSGQMVFPKFAQVPAGGGDERFEQLVRYEIEQNIPFPIDEMVCDRQILGQTEGGDKNVMIVAAKVDQIEAITSAVKAAGFSPELVDVSPIALTNAIRFNRAGDADECVVALDIGAKTTSLVIVEGDKIYNRSIPVAGNNITREISSALGCSSEEAEALKIEKGYVSAGGVTEDEDEQADRISKVCRAVMTRLQAEISRSINFYRSQQHGGVPVKLYLTGGSALLPQIDLFFSEALGIEVEFFNPFEAIAVGPKVDAQALESDAALLAATSGLALHMAGLSRFAINLLPPSIVSERREMARIPFVAAGGAAMVAALVLVVLGVNKSTEVIEAQRDAVQGCVESLSSFDRKVTAATAELDYELSQAEVLRKILSDRSSAVARINAVRESLAPGMWIDRWDSGRITIRGWRENVKGAGGKTAGELFIDKLKTKSVVDATRAKISDMSAVGADGQVEQFTVEVKFK